MKHHSLLQRLFLITFLFSAISFGDSFVIDHIQNANVSCDYLILTPNEFLDNAERLAAHRSTYNGDGVNAPGIVLLDTVYAEFPVTDSMPPHHSIWHAVKWAADHWTLPPAYLVLLGDDSLWIPPDSGTNYSVGHMPTYVYDADSVPYILSGTVDTVWQSEFEFSDMCYAMVSDSQLPYRYAPYPYESLAPQLAVGRIPCENASECSLYISKVIAFDTKSTPKGAWRNRIVLLADDAFQLGRADPLWRTTPYVDIFDKLDSTSLDGRFVQKVYLSFFDYSDENNYYKLDATESYQKELSAGALWSIFVGHAAPNIITDEAVLSMENMPQIGRAGKPVCAYVGSSRLADFTVSRSESLTKSYLFTDTGGYLCCISATDKAYLTGLTDLMYSFFEDYTDSAYSSVGLNLLRAQLDNLGWQAMTFQVLGDPALVLGGQPLDVQAIADTTTIPPIVSLSSSSGQTNLQYAYEFTTPTIRRLVDDTAMSTVIDFLVDSGSGNWGASNEIAIPTSPISGPLEFTAFVWNETHEGRITLRVKDGTMVGIKESRVEPTYATGTFRMRVLKNAISLNGLVAPVSAQIVTMNGRILRETNDFGSDGSTILPFSNGNRMTNGTYLLRIQTAHTNIVRLFCYTK